MNEEFKINMIKNQLLKMDYPFSTENSDLNSLRKIRNNIKNFNYNVRYRKSGIKEKKKFYIRRRIAAMRSGLMVNLYC